MWKDCETNIDYLNINHIIKVLNGLIMDDSLSPATIGVYGNWGSGKSSILSMSEEILSKDKSTLCVKFNSWLFEDYYDARLALIGTILDKISEITELNEGILKKIKRMIKSLKLLNIAKKAVGYSLDILFNNGEKTTEKLIEDDTEDSKPEEKDEYGLRKNIKEFCEDFYELLKEAKLKKLVVYIDELDRCDYQRIIEILESIRLFVFVKGTSFVIGADQRMIEYAVQHKFGDIQGNDVNIGKEYLDKLIQYAITIPLLSRTEMYNYICFLYLEKSIIPNKEELKNKAIQEMNKDIEFRFSLDVFGSQKNDVKKELENILATSETFSILFDQGFQGNPRKCKRFLNGLSMRMKISEYRSLNLDPKVLGKLMIMEYFKPEIFNKVIDEQMKLSGIVPSLRIIGDNEKIEDPFKEYRADKWFQLWLTSSPQLNEIDLKKYIYVSRDNAKYSYTDKQTISTFAEKLFDDLLSSSNITLNLAIANIDKLKDEESIILFDRAYERYKCEAKDEAKYFKLLLNLSNSKICLKEKMISLLNDSLKVVPSLNTMVKNFAKKYDCESQLAPYNKKLTEDENFNRVKKSIKRKTM